MPIIYRSSQKYLCIIAGRSPLLWEVQLRHWQDDGRGRQLRRGHHQERRGQGGGHQDGVRSKDGGLNVCLLMHRDNHKKLYMRTIEWIYFVVSIKLRNQMAPVSSLLENLIWEICCGISETGSNGWGQSCDTWKHSLLVDVTLCSIFQPSTSHDGW